MHAGTLRSSFGTHHLAEEEADSFLGLRLSKEASSDSLKSIRKIQALGRMAEKLNKDYFEKAQMRNGLHCMITNHCQIDHLFFCCR